MLELPFIELRKTGRGDFEERSKVECGTCSIFFIVVIKSYYCLINKLEYPCGLLLIPTQRSSFFFSFHLYLLYWLLFIILPKSCFIMLIVLGPYF